MRLLVDTNIIVDCLMRRKPYDSEANLLIALGKLGELDLWISPTQIGDTFYLLSGGGKPALSEDVQHKFKKLREVLRVCYFGERDIDEALSLNWPDFEDALVYSAARGINAEAIITRNQRDFSRSTIPIFDCNEFFSWYAEKTGIHFATMLL